MKFGETLKNLREIKGITQKDLGKILGVSRATIAGYETKSRQPDFERLVKIAEYFEVSVDYLMRGYKPEDEVPVKECCPQTYSHLFTESR